MFWFLPRLRAMIVNDFLLMSIIFRLSSLPRLVNNFKSQLFPSQRGATIPPLLLLMAKIESIGVVALISVNSCVSVFPSLNIQTLPSSVPPAITIRSELTATEENRSEFCESDFSF